MSREDVVVISIHVACCFYTACSLVSGAVYRAAVCVQIDEAYPQDIILVQLLLNFVYK